MVLSLEEKRGGKKGLFELADNGTLFLDEISEMDKTMQAKVLRAVEEKQIKRIGGSKLIDINIQITAAANKDLKKNGKQRQFPCRSFLQNKSIKSEYSFLEKQD